ncbi:MAG: ribulose-phosphate 3-epimerase [Thermoanaerobaculales bacterium]|nr:ribulose-phosphate 3-epimerase [Thermoanaerobaculales bacterium]
MDIRIAPSLLSADFARLDREVAEIHEAGADLLHLDIMDGHFVPNLTFGPQIIAALAPHARTALDAHLMVTDADALLSPLADCGVSRVAVHVEACTHLNRTLSTIRTLGMIPGVALNPATPASTLEEALNWVDFVLVMSVNPGFGGQSFISASIKKIALIRKMASGRTLDISVDGGVGPGNAEEIVRAGATTLIAGSSVFGQTDRRAAIRKLRALGQKGVSQC